MVRLPRMQFTLGNAFLTVAVFAVFFALMLQLSFASPFVLTFLFCQMVPACTLSLLYGRDGLAVGILLGFGITVALLVAMMVFLQFSAL